MEFKSKKAIYQQIADAICENILLKEWKEGEKIPSVRDYAIALEVNPNTVMRSYSEMQEKGIIINKRGIGFFVSENGIKNALVLKKEEFLKDDIPELLKIMNLLNIDIEDLYKLLAKERGK